MLNNSLNLLILNIDRDFSSFYMGLYKLVFKHNYTVNILDASDNAHDLGAITKAIFKINPMILCIRVFDYNMLPLIKEIVRELSESYIDTLIVLCDVSPENDVIKNIGGIKCDFYCEDNISNTILNMLKFFGSKEVDSLLTNIWYKNGEEYVFVQ